MPILEGKGLTKYFGGLAAVSNVDFHVEQGEVLGLIGPNGAGKTTLFNLITGFYPTDDGAIYFNGQKLNGLGPHQVAELGIEKAIQKNPALGNAVYTTKGKIVNPVYQAALEGRK